MNRSLALSSRPTQLLVPQAAVARKTTEEPPFWTWFIENPTPSHQVVLLVLKFDRASLASR